MALKMTAQEVAPATFVAEARLPKMGRRLAVMEVSPYTADAPAPVAQISGSYALPVKP